MPVYLEGNFDGKGKRFAIVLGRFNAFIAERLLEGAVDALRRSGVADGDITVARVPGAYEIPLVAGKLAASGRFDAVICLGVVIRGATPHFDYVAAEVAKGVAALNRANLAPVIFGVLTTDDIEQAIERAGTKAGNKGWDAALAAIEMVDLCAQLEEES